VPGCSSGEEAYSLAMLLLEAMADAEHPMSVQVFATDIDPAAIEQARRGLYPKAIEDDVSPARLERFFVREDSG
jgi:two-component system CheB/CheR fusion protein